MATRSAISSFLLDRGNTQHCFFISLAGLWQHAAQFNHFRLACGQHAAPPTPIAGCGDTQLLRSDAGLGHRSSLGMVPRKGLRHTMPLQKCGWRRGLRELTLFSDHPTQTTSASPCAWRIIGAPNLIPHQHTHTYTLTNYIARVSLRTWRRLFLAVATRSSTTWPRFCNSYPPIFYFFSGGEALPKVI